LLITGCRCEVTEPPRPGQPQRLMPRPADRGMGRQDRENRIWKLVETARVSRSSKKVIRHHEKAWNLPHKIHNIDRPTTHLTTTPESPGGVGGGKAAHFRTEGCCLALDLGPMAPITANAGCDGSSFRWSRPQPREP
jgi:hypothetical protein